VVEDPVEAKQIAIDGKRALDVGDADQAAAQAARDGRRRRAEADPVAGGFDPVAVGEPVAAPDHLQQVAPWVAHPEMRVARGIAPHRADPDPGIGESLVRERHVLGLDPGAQHAEGAQLDLEAGRLRGPAGELPDLAAAAAVEVDRQNGAPAVDGAAGVPGHQAGGSGLVENADVHPKPAAVPGEDERRVGDAEADLLDAGDHVSPRSAAGPLPDAGNTVPNPSPAPGSAKTLTRQASVPSGW